MKESCSMLSSVRTVVSAVAVGLFIGWTTVAWAKVPSQILKDFKPVRGHVVSAVDGEFLIDLDAYQGISVGDLFSVIQPGKPIVDPASGKVLGTLDEVKGLLQVTRVRNGYSYARPLGAAKGITAGASIRRFSDMKAAFWDYSGHGEALFSELRQALPQLNWESYAAAQQAKPATPRRPAKAAGAEVIFVLTPRALDARDGAYNLLHAYALPSDLKPAAMAFPGAPVPSAGIIPANPQVKANKIPQVSEPPSGPSAIVTAPTPVPLVPAGKSASVSSTSTSATTGIWKSPSIKGKPVGVAVGDFDGDGRQEIAVAFSDHLRISRVIGGRSEVLAQVPLGRTKALGLDAVDLDGDGRSELYVTGAWGQDLASEVVADRGSGYRVTQKEIPWYFRRVTLPGKGPTLLGQRMGSFDEEFSGPIFRVRLTAGRLTAGAAVSVPPRVTLYGFVPLPVADGAPLYVALSDSDHLQVLSAKGESLWESSAVYGGTETSFALPASASGGGESGTREVYMKARLALGAGGEVLVSANEGSRLFAHIRKLHPSRLVALKWDGTTLHEVWHTWPQDGYLADFSRGDANNDGHPDLTLAVGFESDGVFQTLFGSGRTTLFIYPLP
jgi:hypothetical protein